MVDLAHGGDSSCWLAFVISSFRVSNQKSVQVHDPYTYPWTSIRPEELIILCSLVPWNALIDYNSLPRQLTLDYLVTLLYTIILELHYPSTPGHHMTNSRLASYIANQLPVFGVSLSSFCCCPQSVIASVSTTSS